MDVDPEAQVEQLASTQAGCVSRAQALDAGMRDSKIGRRVEAKRWRRAHPGIYVLTAVPPSWEQEVWAAVLAAGRRGPVVREVTVTHETALLVHGVEPCRLPRYPITLTVPHGHHPRVTGAVIHQLDDLAPHHLGEVSGMPVARPARCIVDLAGSLGKVRLASLVDEVTVMRLTTIAEISACLAELARGGKPGVSVAGTVLGERSMGYVPPQSELESRLFALITDAGLPDPVRQYPLPGLHPQNEFVDAAYLDAMIIIEADGRRWHSRISDRKRDNARDAEANRNGWIVLRFTYEEIMTTPHVAATIADVRATRLAQLGRAA